MKNRTANPKSKRILIFVIPVLATYLVWGIYMFATDSWRLFYHYFYMLLVPVRKAGGAIAFPVMTLVFKIHPADARNFSLAIQSIGMTGHPLDFSAQNST